MIISFFTQTSAMDSKHSISVLLAILLTVLKGSFGQEAAKADSFETSLVQSITNDGYQSKSWIASPASIKTVLEEIYLGAGGNTKTSLGSSLHLSDNSADAEKQITSEQDGLNTTPDTGVEWKSANSILVRNNFPLNSSYKDQVSKIFHSEINNTDFSDPTATANTINSWVSKQTEGLITHLVSSDDVGPSSLMVLLNAVYFKGTWKYSFKNDATKKRCFYSTPGNCAQVDMMTQKRMFKYGENKQLGATMVSLPYKDKRYSMVIVLPDKYDGLSDVVKKLPTSKLLESFQNLNMEHINIIMPKFTHRFQANINKPLQEMGLRSIFQDTADFSAMSDSRGIYVSDVIHMAYISVSENGTIAAAATGAVMTRHLANKPSEYVTFNVNHPFLYFILYNNSQILFAGQYVQ